MKYWATVLSLTCVILMGLGCDRREASEAAPAVFDPNHDSHAPITEHNVDSDLLADQAAISRRIQGEKPTLPTTSEEEPLAEGAEGPIGLVKQKVAELITAAQAGQQEQVLEFFAEPNALLALLSGAKEIQTEVQDFEALVKDQLGIELPDDVRSVLASKSEGIGVTESIKNVSVDDLEFEQIGSDVVVTDPKGQKITFVPVGSDYKISLSDKQIELLAIAGELIAAQQEFLDEMTKGIEAGRIDSDNFERRAEAIGKRTIMPVVGKLMKIMLLGAEQPAPETETPAGETERPKGKASLKGTVETITRPLERGTAEEE